MRALIATLVTSLALFSSNAFALDARPSEQKLATKSSMVKASCASAVGFWDNQMGSTLHIKSIDTTTGAISGEYKTSSGASGWYPVTGWVNTGTTDPNNPDGATIISFSVRWTNIGSVTSWTGICRGTGELKTIWNLGRAAAGYEWSHVLTGADQFHPQ